MRSDDASASIDEDVEGVIGSRVTRNWLVAVLRVVVAQLVAGMVFLVLSHELTASEYALYVVAAVVAPMAYSLVATPIGLVLIRRAGTLERRSIDAGFTFLCAYVAFGVVIVAVPATISNAVTPLLVGVGAAYVMSLVLTFPAYVVLQRNLQSARTSIIELVDRVAFQVTAMVFVLVGSTVEQAVALGLISAGFAVVGLSQAFVRWRPTFTSPRRIEGELRESVNPFIVVGTSLATEGGIVPLLGIVASATQAGLYGWAYSILAIPTGFVHAATTTLYPAFARVGAEHLETAIRLGNRLVSAMAVIVASIVAASMPALVGTVFPERWDPAIPVVWLLLASLVAYAATAVANTYWNARRSLPQFARWQVASTVVVFTLASTLGAVHGAIGAAVGYLAGRLVLALCLIVAMRREAKIDIAGGFVASMLAAGAATSAGLAASSRVDSEWAQLAVAIGASGITALLALEVVSRGHLRRDLASAWQMFRSRAEPVVDVPLSP